MENRKTGLSYLIYLLLVVLIFTGCDSSSPKDLEPVINGRFKQAKAIYYPSTDIKVSAVVVDKNGDVWYLRMNALADMRDEKILFNISEYCD